MNIIEYRTVSAISSKELDNAINHRLRQGFQPFGNPYVVGTGSQQSIYQALIKYEGAVVHAEPTEERVPQIFKPTQP